MVEHNLNSGTLSFYLTLLNLFNIFHIEILNNFKICSDIVNVFDTTQLDFITFYHSNSLVTVTNIILPTVISSNASILHPKLPSKFSSICALTVQDISEFLVALAAKHIAPEGITPWEPPALFGSALKEFHVFSVRSCSQELLLLARPLMRKIYNLFIVQSCESSLTLFRITSDGQSISNFGEIQNRLSRKTLVYFPNFNSEPFNIVTCKKCPNAIRLYKITGIWSNSLIGVLYEFSMLINGTLEAKEVLGIPRDNPDKDGNWDAWFQPVVDGSAAVSVLSRVTAHKSHLAYITVPVLYDWVVFITAKPERVPGSQSLLTLFTPLRIPVWVACATSGVILFSVIELTIKIRRQRCFQNSFDRCSNFRRIFVGPMPAILQSFSRKPPRHFQRLTLAALMKPLVDQSPLNSRLFLQNIRSESLHRFIFAIWFLGAIVLRNCYTSVMTSQIVLPVFTNPPITFHELAHSNYNLSAFAWTGNFELDFKALNASYMQRFLERVQDFDPHAPDCYVSILNGHTACIGPYKLLAFLGFQFIVDANGEPLFSESKETHFPFAVDLTISHYYPLLYEPLNRMVESFWEAGFIHLWEANQIRMTLSMGKENARRSLRSRKREKETNNDGEQSYLSGFLLGILVFGSSLGTLAYVYELICVFLALLLKKVVGQSVGVVCPFI